jgi:ribonuclease R
MRDKLGEEVDGVISGVTSFGIVVALHEVFVEGLVHVSDLGQDYFHFDDARHQMLGERTGKRFRLGYKVRIKVAQVELETSKIDFVLVDESRPVAKKGAESGADKSAPAKAAPAKKAPAKKPAAKKKGQS